MLPSDQEALSHFITEDGDLHSGWTKAKPWSAPQTVRVDGSDLLYDQLGKWRQITKPSPLLFEKFLTLWGQQDTVISSFAKRYGVLNLCQEHQRPHTHTYFHCRIGADVQGVRESLQGWRNLSREAYSILAVANRLFNGDLGKPEDWNVVSHRARQIWPDRGAPMTQTVKRQKFLLANALNNWIEMADMRPRLSWQTGKRPTVQPLGGYGLFAHLTTQLIFASAGVRGAATCAHCGIAFIPPNRRPKEGQRSFCPKCRKSGKPQHYSVADWRQRQREEMAE